MEKYSSPKEEIPVRSIDGTDTLVLDAGSNNIDFQQRSRNLSDILEKAKEEGKGVIADFSTISRNQDYMGHNLDWTEECLNNLKNVGVDYRVVGLENNGYLLRRVSERVREHAEKRHYGSIDDAVQSFNK